MDNSVEPSPTQELIGSAQPLTPAAWRVKDFADGWILCHWEAQAIREAESAGNLVQPLFTIDALSRYATLGEACEANGLVWLLEDGEMRFQAPPDVIEEQATAPLYQNIERLRAALAGLVAVCEVVDEEYGGGLPVPDEDWDEPLNAARAALSDGSASDRVTDAPEPSTGRLDTNNSDEGSKPMTSPNPNEERLEAVALHADQLFIARRRARQVGTVYDISQEVFAAAYPGVDLDEVVRRAEAAERALRQPTAAPEGWRDHVARLITGAIARHDDGVAAVVDSHHLADQIAALSSAPPAPVQQGEGDDLFGRIYQAAVRITGDQVQAHNIATDALSTPEEPAEESPASYADREGVERRVERIVREHFYPGPVAGSTSRLASALIAEFNVSPAPVGPDAALVSLAVERLDEEIARHDLKGDRARDLGVTEAADENYRCADAPRLARDALKQSSPVGPTREEVARTLFGHMYPETARLFGYDEMPDASLAAVMRAADAILALLSRSEGKEVRS